MEIFLFFYLLLGVFLFGTIVMLGQVSAGYVTVRYHKGTRYARIVIALAAIYIIALWPIPLIMAASRGKR